jgi:predicted ATP-binding protein involved in virulence
LISSSGRLRESKVNYEYPASALVGALDSLSDFEEMLKWFDQEEAAELRSNKGCPPEDWNESPTLSSVRGVISAILGGAFHNPQFNSKHQFVVESRTTPGMFLQVAQLSQGYQSMLALGMDFARRLALANSHLNNDNIMPIIGANRAYIHPDVRDPAASPPLFAPAIMLVDEIDLHLHPSWQQRVLGDLMRAFPCTQFIVTTHSPQVLTTLRKENIRVLACDEDGHWTANEPSISPLAHESGDALALIMGTHPRPEISNVMPDLYAYEQVARAGHAVSEEASQIKSRLDAAGFEFKAADRALFSFLAAKAEQSKAETP